MPIAPAIHPLLKDARSYERALTEGILHPMVTQAKRRVATAQKNYEGVRTAIQGLHSDPALQGIANKEASTFFQQQKRAHTTKFRRAMRRYLGVRVDLLTDTPINLEARITENVDLIKTIPGKFHDGLKKRLHDLQADTPFDEHKIAGMLNKEYKSAGYNLRRLTRDQNNKLIGQLNHSRQTEVGIDRYQWLTAGDERVRDTHAANDGSVFLWSDPPGTGEPGSEIQCRCVAIPIVSPDATKAPPEAPEPAVVQEPPKLKPPKPKKPSLPKPPKPKPDPKPPPALKKPPAGEPTPHKPKPKTKPKAEPEPPQVLPETEAMLEAGFTQAELDTIASGPYLELPDALYKKYIANFELSSNFKVAANKAKIQTQAVKPPPVPKKPPGPEPSKKPKPKSKQEEVPGAVEAELKQAGFTQTELDTLASMPSSKYSDGIASALYEKWLPHKKLVDRYKKSLTGKAKPSPKIPMTPTVATDKLASLGFTGDEIATISKTLVEPVKGGAQLGLTPHPGFKLQQKILANLDDVVNYKQAQANWLKGGGQATAEGWAAPKPVKPTTRARKKGPRELLKSPKTTDEYRDWRIGPKQRKRQAAYDESPDLQKKAGHAHRDAFSWQGDVSFEITKKLRHGIELDGYEQAIFSGLQKAAKPMKKRQLLFRGISDNRKFKAGDDWTAVQPTASSSDLGTASSRAFANGQTVLEIHPKPGQKAFQFTEGVNKGEYEYVLPAGTEFEVVSVAKNVDMGGGHIIKQVVTVVTK